MNSWKDILKQLFIVQLLVVVFVSVYSCSVYDDSNTDHIHRVNMGVVYNYLNSETSNNMHYIVGDNGTIFHIAINLMPNIPMYSGQRVRFSYEILNIHTVEEQGESEELDIKLYSIQEILTKEPVALSFIAKDPEHRQDSIGNDPIRIKKMWLGGGYLNLTYDYPHREDAKTVHMLNVVNEDLESLIDPRTKTSDIRPVSVIVLDVRHNGYDDVPLGATDEEYKYGHEHTASFNLMEIMPAGETEADIVVKWTEYGKDWSVRVSRSEAMRFMVGDRLTKELQVLR